MEIIKGSTERKTVIDGELKASVASIIDDVRKNGDKALFEYNRRFDGSMRDVLRVSPHEIEEAYSMMMPEEIDDIKAAAANIRAFAAAQKASVGEVHDFEPSRGIYLGHRLIPVNSVCCYVPGGGYPLYSTALMLTIPAKVAGVKRVVCCSPAVKGTGIINYKTLVAMDIAGADEIYAVGGAQAIAAFSYGTETIKPVDMIVGPGNRYVAEAKRQCYGQVGIDFVAGPSEVLVIADGSGDPATVAADMLAQAEHDVNAKSILISMDRDFAEQTIAAIEKELLTLPTAVTAAKSWEDNGEVIVVEDRAEAVYLANEFAPEHLELNVSDPDSYFDRLNNYGSLFMGANTAEVFGDYASGTNHTLPTVRASRYTGGLWVGMFLKVCTYQRMTDEASRDIAVLASRMAYGEGLIGHAWAAEARMKNKPPKAD